MLLKFCRQWQISLASRPSDEQRLWKQFREPIDTLFNRLRDERQQRRDAINAQKAEVERIEAEKRQQELERKQQKIDALQALNAQSNAAKQEASMKLRNTPTRLKVSCFAFANWKCYWV